MQSNSTCSIIPTNLLSLISGGTDDNPQAPQPTSPVTVVGGGNANVAGGAVIASIPINPNTTAMPFVNVNSVNGVTGGGAVFVYRW